MNKVQRIHFIGVKGVGMTPLALIAHEAKIEVTGSDVPDTFITDTPLKESNIPVYKGFSPDHIGAAELVVVTNAHGGYDNIEAQTAKQRGIPVISQAQAVGEFMNGEVLGRSFVGISVTGTHGKTTTTAMIATLLNAARQEPSYIIGTSYVPSLGLSGHLGKGNYFVAEADEYITESTYDTTPKFLWQHPQILVMTNLEYDHPDVYKDIESVKAAFAQFAQQVPNTGVLIICGDDEKLREISRYTKAKVITYGFLRGNDIIISSVQVGKDKTSFELSGNDGTPIGSFSVPVPGEHNVLNATAAMLAVRQAGVEFKDLGKYLSGFKGSKRRLEYLGESVTGAVLYDDYGHHPTEIKASLKTLAQLYSKAYIICIFQPHTFSRTQALFDDFVTAFDDVDLTIITEIYASAREINSGNINSQSIVNAMIQRGRQAVYVPTLPDVLEYIRQQNFPKPTVIVTMGAGDVYKILPEL